MLFDPGRNTLGLQISFESTHLARVQHPALMMQTAAALSPRLVQCFGRRRDIKDRISDCGSMLHYVLAIFELYRPQQTDRYHPSALFMRIIRHFGSDTLASGEKSQPERSAYKMLIDFRMGHAGILCYIQKRFP